MDPNQPAIQTGQPGPVSVMQQYRPLAMQFLRFAIVGLINTGIDFAIFNILSVLTKITEGTGIIPIKAAAFLGATINSYLLNKRWTFKDNTSDDSAKKFSVYLTVSIVGALINISTVYLVTTHTEPILGLSDLAWANVANLLATGLSLIWNFLGYKLIVFKR